MVYLKIIHLKDQLWTVIARLLSVLLLADTFYSPILTTKIITEKYPFHYRLYFLSVPLG